MLLYDKNENRVYVSFRKSRRGRSPEVKKWDFEPIQLISDFGNKKNPYFVTMPADYPQWVDQMIKESPVYMSESYPEQGVLVLRHFRGSNKALFYRQYMEQFILYLFTNMFVKNDRIDYTSYREQLLQHIEVVSWNIFNNQEKLQELHNIKVEFDISNPELIGAAYFDLYSVANDGMEEQVESFVRTLIDDTDYVASGEDEAEIVQSLLAMNITDVAENGEEESVEVESVANLTNSEPVESNVDAVASEVKAVTEKIEPVAIDVQVEAVTEEIEPVAIDVQVEVVAKEIEPVAIDVQVEAVTEEIELLEPEQSNSIFEQDDDFELFILENNSFVAPKRNGSKSISKKGLALNTLF